jgi:hypothetical protein
MEAGAKGAAALCAAIVAALVMALPAQAAKKMEIALEDEGAFVDQSVGNREASFAIARALNVTRMRIVVQWNRVSDSGDPTPSGNPDYNWGPIDDAIDQAAANGIHTMLTLTGPAPVYASGNHQSSYPIVNPNPAMFADFARAAAEHFKGRVDRYAIWNEPNYPAWLSPVKKSPQIYRALYSAGYDAIKAADPAAKVLIGETVPYGGKAGGKKLGLATPPLKWLRAVACVNARYRKVGNCAPLKADGYAHHPYEFTRAPKGAFPGADNAPIQELGRLRNALRKISRAGTITGIKNIYLTESGYFVSGRRAVAAQRRSSWLPEQFNVAARTPGVRSMLQYNLYVPNNSTFTTGLFQPTGQPLPEFRSLLSWTTMAVRKGLARANTGPITLPPRPGAPPTAQPAPAPAPSPPSPGCLVALLGTCIVPGG